MSVATERASTLEKSSRASPPATPHDQQRNETWHFAPLKYSGLEGVCGDTTLECPCHLRWGAILTGTEIMATA